jgi:5-methylcytosine-specific restriction endonuclease McrA
VNFRGLDCTLARDPRGDTKGHCWWCGEPLSKYARKWCGTGGSCERAWWRNHSWTEARVEALRRSSGIPYDFALAYFWARCDQCDSQESLEVNHVEPRVGRGYAAGCWNHQSNLQVLCHNCHVKETKRQAIERPVMSALNAGLITPETAQRYIDDAMAYMGRAARKRAGLPRLPSTPMPGFRAERAS